jgi:hypothetical protein
MSTKVLEKIHSLLSVNDSYSFTSYKQKGETKANTGKAMRLPKNTHAQAAHCKNDY